MVADLVVYSEFGGTLSLISKPFAEDGASWTDWEDLPGASVQVTPGISSHTLVSDCLSNDEQIHIRGELRQPNHPDSRSDLHYVIVDADVVCP